MTIRGIGTAPVSFGVYGTSEHAAGIKPRQVVEAMVSSGYGGAELPPPGYAGSPGAAAELFADHGLAVAGIYIPVHFTMPGLRDEDEARMEEALDELEAADVGPRVAILADEGDETLLSHPARGSDLSHALDTDSFDALAIDVGRLCARIRDRGFEPSFHPHISTYVETPREIERLLDATDVGLTFDTGHVALGGGDILSCWDAWRSRVNHVHLKDVRMSVLEQAKEAGRSDFDTWWADVSLPLGDGDLRLAEFTSRLVTNQFDGWVVVEQDSAPLATEGDLRTVTREQTHNLEWIHNTIGEQPMRTTESTSY